ncbi:hypothetical protein [Pelagibacterium montanilacus]|uniref:hypothetical protein n=1 Tax=Pelagibacterium montanilacus TaxID=2185280 RepID=UPI000F8F1842|nr:hypothetical protein [Pelagibacterium montanilacus]
MIVSAMALAGAATPAIAERAPLPEILDCAVLSNASWLAGGFTVLGGEDETSYTIHINTLSGEWYLSNAHSAALTVGGGTYAIREDGTHYPFRWIGLDNEGAAQLRIEMTRAPDYPFVFLGFDNALMAGTCTVPDEIFLFLDR